MSDGEIYTEARFSPAVLEFIAPGSRDTFAARWESIASVDIEHRGETYCRVTLSTAGGGVQVALLAPDVAGELRARWIAAVSGEEAGSPAVHVPREIERRG